MVDIGVLSLAAMDHGPHTKIMSYQTFFLEKWQSNGDYVAMSENVLFPNLHWTRKVFHGNQVIFSEPWNCQLFPYLSSIYTKENTSILAAEAGEANT